MSQDYPGKAIRIVTSPAGGGNDFPARLVARGISGPIGQQVIVDNRPAILAPEIVAKAAPDGYTLLMAGSVNWIGPLVEKVSYDPIRDFAPVSLIVRYLQSAEGKSQFLKGGIEAAASTPEALTATIKSEVATIGKVLKAAGVNPP